MNMLLKNSPLKGVFERSKAKMDVVAGWNMAVEIGDKKAGEDALQNASVLVDWSHIGKITINGENATKEMTKLFLHGKSLEDGKASVDDGMVVFRHLEGSYTILCEPDNEEGLLDKLTDSKCNIIRTTGSSACMVLAGPGRDNVLERSTAMNLRRDIYPQGSVIQTSVHTVTTTIYRMLDAELLLCSRNYCESLFDGMCDVGVRLGMRHVGLNVLPVKFS